MSSYETYRESLNFRLGCAKYHYDIVENLSKQSNVEDMQVPISAEFIAMMLALQSSLDILAQCINYATRPDCHEGKISFQRLYEKLNELNLEPDIKEGIKCLYDETRYLNAFCNVSKHRKMIKISDQCAFIAPWQPVQYLVIEGFEYHNQEFKQKDLINVTKDTFHLLHDKLKDIILLIEEKNL